MYGSLAGARAYGATLEDAVLTDALNDAEERIDRYTSDHFEPIVDTLVLKVEGGGFAWAPMRLRTVSGIASVDPSLTIASTAWRTVPAAGSKTGDPDLIGVQVSLSGGDPLIVGAEPWNGGFANLYGGLNYVEVSGEWGWPTTPRAVVEAANRLAAFLAPKDYAPSADSEGNPSTVPGQTTVPAPGSPTAAAWRVKDEGGPEPVEAAGRLERTTGSAAVDRLLQPYRRQTWRVG